MAASHVSGPFISANGFVATAGGMTITAGGLTVTAGGITITAGNLTVVSGTMFVSGNFQQGGTGVEGSANSGANYAPIVKAAVVDNTITTVCTITCPNVAAAGVYRILGLTTLTGANAYESTRVFEYLLVLTRTAGAALVGTIIPVEDSATNPVTNVNQLVVGTQATVAAGATLTSSVLALGAVAGAVGATNTMTIRVTTVASVAQVSQTNLKIDGINAATGGITIA